MYNSSNIEWINEALPKLELLGTHANRFDFALPSGVWHHLDKEEQQLAIQRTARPLSINGVFTLTLRNGPAGAGTHVFSTNGKQTVKDVEHYDS